MIGSSASTAERGESKSRLGARFWRLWWANAINSVGDGAFVAAMPLLAVTVTRDPVMISLISVGEYLPWLVVSLPAGVYVDRHDRATLMWRCQAVQALIVALVAATALLHIVTIAELIIASFLLGCAQVVITNAAQAVLPELVPAAALQQANSNQYTVQTVGQSSAGPPLGSIMFAVAAPLPFGVDAVSFIVSAALLASLPQVRVDRKQVPMRTAVPEGLRWLLGHRLLRTLALLLGLNTFCNQMGFATLVLLGKLTLHLTSAEYGLLLVGVGVGSVIGGLINTRLARRFGALPTFVGALAANAVLYAGMGLASNGVVLGVLIALSGLVITVSSVVTVSMRQQLTPNELFGRVNSVFRMIGWGLMPLGALAGGFLAQLFGFRAPFVIAGAIRAVVLVAMVPILVDEMRAVHVKV
ncbi:MFS transporter [Actinoallomurus rhizosphaericola]|uniref:MFS transporter n=1 Tax=Actinoallomurus rhizosphaericola TaxID=2952536 RepID=UPI002093102E|nr:MFS transporter [Actinoallomurus rhizosphaericola]MCO5997982.1 MFS transporter [Actinoallomurus rhizosphaericola]